MNEKITAIIEKIRKKAAELNQRLQPPASDEQIETLIVEAREQLGNELPAEYVEFLRTVNGLLWDNLYMYASTNVPHTSDPEYMVEGFIDANLECRETFEPYNDLLLFGYSGNLDTYALELSSGKYQILDRGSLSPVKNFKTFDKLLLEILRFNM